LNNAAHEQLKRDDCRYLWHPFTQMRAWVRDDPLIIEQGDGNFLIDVNGRRYLDGVSSLWCNIHGHRKAELDLALREQTERVAHSTMLGLSNLPAIELARELVQIAPAGLSRVFYSDSGAEAVEVAVRMAAQYWQLVGETDRKVFLTLTESYHGDTIGSASLGYSEHFHKHIRGLLFPVLKTDPPHVFRFYRKLGPDPAIEKALECAARIIEAHRGELAALIIEPMMQGAAGMWSHSAAYLAAIAKLARDAGALVIADEVATGFGRTGVMFACEHARLRPDLMCLGKGITGGYLPLAATLASEPIFEAFLGEPHEHRAFYYGHTYTGNPLAASVAIANLKLFRTERTLNRIQARIAQLSSDLESRFVGLSHVADIRQCGMMVGIELMQDPARRIGYDLVRTIGHRVIRCAREKGVIIRPLGDVIVLMPPLSINESELKMLLDVTYDCIAEITGE